MQQDLTSSGLASSGSSHLKTGNTVQQLIESREGEAHSGPHDDPYSADSAASRELDSQVRVSGQAPQADNCANEGPGWDTTDEVKQEAC